MAQFQYLTPFGSPAPGAVVQQAGGGTPYRDELDYRRMAIGARDVRTPNASWPDGYLGTYKTRREDRLLDSLRNRINQRSYQRGVHKGERIDPADYYWPPDFGPMTSLEHQSRGERFAPLVDPVYQMLTNDGKPMPRGTESILEVNPHRREELQRYKAPWR